MVLVRLREFYREPEAVFWVYGFPVIMMAALGIAFRDRPIEKISVDVQAGSDAEQVVEVLSQEEVFEVAVHNEAVCRRRLRIGRSDLFVEVDGSSPRFRYHFDPTKPGSLVARNAVNDVLQRDSGREDAVAVENVEKQEPGGRYIDFLVPGLLGMGLMGGGLWGIGFVTVDLRIRRLLKRFLATPMRKTDFLAGLMISRMAFMVPEVLTMLFFGWLVFGVKIEGSLLLLTALILLGATMFAGIGLLVASRARTLEAVSGIMNLVMLPMWVMSGIFFSTDRFPDAAQPFIQALPLTALNDALRAVMLEGSGPMVIAAECMLMLAWAAGSFLLALKWFRWDN